MGIAAIYRKRTQVSVLSGRSVPEAEVERIEKRTFNTWRSPALRGFIAQRR